MARFLIEVPHEKQLMACTKAVELFLRTGSHYLTHADWGCLDGDHRSWLIVETQDKDEARMIVPPDLRAKANVVQLNTFTMEQIEQLRQKHLAQ